MKAIIIVAALLCCCYLAACQVYSCPPVSSDEAGLCSEECNSDSDCLAPHKCCSNGCGHVCTAPTLTPYHPPPYVCPTPSEDIAGICTQECNTTSCDSGYQCCSNGCGQTCMSICNLVSTNQTLIGAYRPQCEDDGLFSLVQCHASTGYCWCVEPLGGEPRSELVRGETPQCSCVYDGEVRSVGEVFQAIDGFNYCTCTVTGPQCTENKVFHSCPPVREDDEAGICVAECTLDSECMYDTKCCYTGCGYSCTDPEVTPYIPLPTMNSCPPTNQVPCTLSGRSCAQSNEEEASTDTDDESSDSDSSDGLVCDDDTSMCCENDCGSSVCVYRTGLTPCKDARMIAKDRNNTTESMVGRYSPQCDFDGHFRPVQCHEHYCWCVDEHTGQPESDMVAFEHIDNLQCTKCVYNGLKHGHLDQFPSTDGCNTCTCVYDGVISCTEVACVEPEEESNLWDWWHSILIYCVVAVIVLTMLVLTLLMAVVITFKRNSFRHRRLKEAAVHFDSEMDTVYFKQGQDLTSVELKVPPAEENGRDDHA